MKRGSSLERYHQKVQYKFRILWSRKIKKSRKLRKLFPYLNFYYDRFRQKINLIPRKQSNPVRRLIPKRTSPAVFRHFLLYKSLKWLFKNDITKQFLLNLTLRNMYEYPFYYLANYVSLNSFSSTLPVVLQPSRQFICVWKTNTCKLKSLRLIISEFD